MPCSPVGKGPFLPPLCTRWEETTLESCSVMVAYRLVAMDVDGTLLDEHGELSLGTQAVLQRLSAAGVILALATSRRLTGTMPVAEALGLRSPLIIYDGAQI